MVLAKSLQSGRRQRQTLNKTKLCKMLPIFDLFMLISIGVFHYKPRTSFTITELEQT